MPGNIIREHYVDADIYSHNMKFHCIL